MQGYKSVSSNMPKSDIEFSICTIVNDLDEYSLMKQSFEDCGFSAGCEYLIADNSKGNVYDAYQSISLFLKQSVGQYLIIVHQDVRCIDRREVLLKCFDEVSAVTPDWAVCGNAGGRGYREDVIYITYESHIEKYTKLPQEVNSLDENFLVINKAANITISHDLHGFHLYGTDLCIIANFMGYHCFVIPFMVLHYSKGNLRSLAEYKREFIEAYGRKFSAGYIQTTCTRFYLSNRVWKNIVFNYWHPIPFLIKQVQRYSYLLSKAKQRYKTIKYSHPNKEEKY